MAQILRKQITCALLPLKSVLVSVLPGEDDWEMPPPFTAATLL